VIELHESLGITAAPPEVAAFADHDCPGRDREESQERVDAFRQERRSDEVVDPEVIITHSAENSFQETV
jgi:hypothetical protein